MSASEKPIIFERLFRARWNEVTASLSNPLVTLEDVKVEIRAAREAGLVKLSDSNVANFMKDFLRSDHASSIWPDYINQNKYTARQVTEGGNCFEFIEFSEGQTEAFPVRFKPREETPRTMIQSLSIPVASKVLGRKDETWLMQALVSLQVVETYFAVHSSQRLTEIFHLQNNVKLRKTETDAVFRGTLATEEGDQQVYITCEAKQGDPLIGSQIANQATAALETEGIERVIPIGVRNLGKKGLYFVEFGAFDRNDLVSDEALTVAGDALFIIRPALKGVN